MARTNATICPPTAEGPITGLSLPSAASGRSLPRAAGRPCGPWGSEPECPPQCVMASSSGSASANRARRRRQSTIENCFKRSGGIDELVTRGHSDRQRVRCELYRGVFPERLVEPTFQAPDAVSLCPGRSLSHTENSVCLHPPPVEARAAGLGEVRPLGRPAATGFASTSLTAAPACSMIHDPARPGALTAAPPEGVAQLHSCLWSSSPGIAWCWGCPSPCKPGGAQAFSGGNPSSELRPPTGGRPVRHRWIARCRFT